MSNTTESTNCNVKSKVGEIDYSSLADEDRNVCWICLDGDSPTRPLIQPCNCPRFCHARCLARWQLQSAGTRRESQCDFCNGRLPDWRQVLSFDLSTFNAPAIMNVNFEGKTYSFEVKPGTSGYLQFTDAIRQAFQLPADSELNITFTCDEPCTEASSLLTLQGPGAYDAAVYCASISAARRQLGQRSHRSHTITGINEVEEPDGTVGVFEDSIQELTQQQQQQPPQAPLPSQMRTHHHRSRTTIGTRREIQTPAVVYQSEEDVPMTGTSGRMRFGHSRTRSSLLAVPNSSNLSTSSSERTRTRTIEERSNRRSKRWAKVTKKMRAIYQKFTQK